MTSFPPEATSSAGRSSPSPSSQVEEVGSKVKAPQLDVSSHLYVDKITKTKVIVPFIFGILDLYCTKIHVLLDVCITDTEIYGKRTSILCISYLEEQALKLPTPVNAPRETQALFEIIFDSYFSTGYFPCTAAASKAKGHIKKAGSSSMGEATIAAPRKYCFVCSKKCRGVSISVSILLFRYEGAFLFSSQLERQVSCYRGSPLKWGPAFPSLA